MKTVKVKKGNMLLEIVDSDLKKYEKDGFELVKATKPKSNTK